MHAAVVLVIYWCSAHSTLLPIECASCCSLPKKHYAARIYTFSTNKYGVSRPSTGYCELCLLCTRRLHGSTCMPHAVCQWCLLPLRMKDAPHI